MLRLRGYGSAEAAAVYDRAFALCREGEATTDRFEALWGLWMVSSSRTESGFAASAALSRELLTAAEDAGQPFLHSYATSAAANIALWQGRLEDACRYAEAAVAGHVEPQRGDRRLDGHDPRVAGYAYTSWARFAQGRVRDATEASARSVALARTLDHPDSLCFALVHAATLRRFMRDAAAAMELAQEAMALASRYDLPLWQGAGALVTGWALAYNGDANSLEILSASVGGVRRVMPGILVAFLHPLAEVYGFLGDTEAQLRTVDEALAAAARLDEHFHLPDLLRLRGEGLARLERTVEAAAALAEAMRVAEAQGAHAFQLRAAVALATVFHQLERYADAAAVVGPLVTIWDDADATADLRAARELLKTGGEVTSASSAQQCKSLARS
jgi:tetratricopeptide (TPR) repeat protein